MLTAGDECRCHLSFDRSPYLLNGVEIGRVWGKICEADTVFSSVFPDENRVVRTEIVQHDNQAFVWICTPEFLEHLPDILLFGAFPEGDNGVTIDGKNAKGVGPDLLGVLHQWGAPKRPHTLSIGRGLGRALIKEREHGVLAHPGKVF